MSEGREGTRNNEEGVGRGIVSRFLRVVKVVLSRDFNEFERMSIVMWNGNEDSEG